MGLKVFGVHLVMEFASMLLAARRMNLEIGDGGAAHVIDMGHLLRAQAGVPGVINREAPIPEGSGGADVAGNAETQILRLSTLRPDMRVIGVACETLYRIVARRSAGISSIADLKGKRVCTFPRTSAAYYLVDELRRAGLTEADVTIVHAAPATEVQRVFLDGGADAVAIWEPPAQNILNALGDDGIQIRSPGAYRLIYCLNTTAAKIADPVKRPQFVAYLREVIKACRDIAADPSVIWDETAAISGYPIEEVRAGFPHHRWEAGLPADLLDVMVEEDKWIAAEQNRAPRGRAELATLIDDSVLKEALAC